MHISSLTLFHLRLPYVTPFQTSRWTEYDRECVLVRLQADGLTAWGECVASTNCGYSYETVKTNWIILEDFLVPAVLAAQIDSIEDYRAAISDVSGHSMAKAGLELAFWDFFAQRAGVSLQTFIGGHGDRVKVGVSIGIQPTTEKLLQVVDGYLAEGYQRVKLKIKPGRDIADTAAVRRAHPDLLLQVDANSVYRLPDSDHLLGLDDFGLLLIEQPFAQDDIIDHAKLQPRLKTPVCLDESIHSVEHARWALELQAARVINIKPGRVGGLSEAIKIHDYCHARHIPVWMGGMLETGIGRAANVAVASLPGFTLPGDISASARYFPQDIIEPAFELNPDSTLSVPTGVGLGVNVVLERIEQQLVRKQEFKK